MSPTLVFKTKKQLAFFLKQYFFPFFLVHERLMKFIAFEIRRFSRRNVFIAKHVTCVYTYILYRVCSLNDARSNVQKLTAIFCLIERYRCVRAYEVSCFLEVFER